MTHPHLQPTWASLHALLTLISDASHLCDAWPRPITALWSWSVKIHSHPHQYLRGCFHKSASIPTLSTALPLLRLHYLVLKFNMAAKFNKKLQVDISSSMEIGVGIGNVLRTTLNQTDVSILDFRIFLIFFWFELYAYLVVYMSDAHFFLKKWSSIFWFIFTKRCMFSFRERAP